MAKSKDEERIRTCMREKESGIEAYKSLRSTAKELEKRKRAGIVKNESQALRDWMSGGISFLAVRLRRKITEVDRL